MASKPEDADTLTESLSKTTLNEEPLASNPSQSTGSTQTASTSFPVPDPEEDDLDDLDDMLDDFTPSKPIPKPAPAPTNPTTSTSTSKNTTTTAPEEGITDSDFAAQLQASMAELLGSLESSPDIPNISAIENIVAELSGPAAAASLGAPSTSNPETTPSDKTFQETIQETMSRIHASDTTASTASTATTANEDDLIAEMLKAMQGADGNGGGSEEDFSKMLMGMMEQLTNKDILYEPMKELDDKFPAWMEKHEGDGTVKEADMERYKLQRGYVREIVGRFERSGYRDEDVGDREFIVERMQKMQSAGSPPPDLVGDMAAAQEAFGAPEEGCPQQ